MEWEILAPLLGTGILIIGGIAGYLIKRGKDMQRLNQLEQDMRAIKKSLEDQGAKIVVLDKDHDGRLIAIETRLAGIETALLTVATDVKKILSNNIVI